MQSSCGRLPELISVLSVPQSSPGHGAHAKKCGHHHCHSESASGTADPRSYRWQLEPPCHNRHAEMAHVAEACADAAQDSSQTA
jgi:hypothetical protein